MATADVRPSTVDNFESIFYQLRFREEREKWLEV